MENISGYKWTGESRACVPSHKDYNVIQIATIRNIKTIYDGLLNSMDDDVRNAIRNYSRLNKTEQAAAAGAELLATMTEGIKKLGASKRRTLSLMVMVWLLANHLRGSETEAPLATTEDALKNRLKKAWGDDNEGGRITNSISMLRSAIQLSHADGGDDNAMRWLAIAFSFAIKYVADEGGGTFHDLLHELPSQDAVVSQASLAALTTAHAGVRSLIINDFCNALILLHIV